MHLWTVEGAHRMSGREMVDSIEAMTEEEAREEAQKRGILVSSVRLSVVEERPPADLGLNYLPPNSASRPAPTYENIIKGEKWLGVLASIYTVCGVLCFLFAVVAVVMMLVTLEKGVAAGAALIVPLISCVIVAIMCFMSAAFARFTGSVGLAVRDMARNSFNQR